MLIVIILFCLVSFLFRNVLPAKITMDQQTVKLLTYKGNAQDVPIWRTRFVQKFRRKDSTNQYLKQSSNPMSLHHYQKGASSDEKNHKAWRLHMRRKLQTSRRNGTMCGAIWHWLKMQHSSCWWNMTVWEMTASEMEQRLGSFCKQDFRVQRRRRWWLWWHSLLDCSSRNLRIGIASSLEDRNCSQGYKKQGKQTQRPSSTPWSSMVCR